MLIGAVGAFLPIIPGPLIAFIGVLIFKLLFPSQLSWTFIICAGLLTLAAQVLDFAMSWFGAKKFGATWRGGLGAFIGVFVGLFLPPPLIWVFIAPFFGAFIGEYLGGASVKMSGKAGLGAFIGNILASVIKFVMIVAMATWFTFEVALK